VPCASPSRPHKDGPRCRRTFEAGSRLHRFW
jgi:hypothetical protein